MIESILYKTAIYCRLSLDDGSLGESGSIQTQKMMLEKYCRDNNFTIKEVYIDDGYSGLNFDRAAFKRLIADIESGKINLVITKDLFCEYGKRMTIAHKVRNNKKDTFYKCARPLTNLSVCQLFLQLLKKFLNLL